MRSLAPDSAVPQFHHSIPDLWLMAPTLFFMRTNQLPPPPTSYDCNRRCVRFVSEASVKFPIESSLVPPDTGGMSENGGLNGSGICVHP